MTRMFLSLMVATGIAGFGLVTGCDDTLKKEESVKTQSDGTVVHKKDEVRETPTGDIVKEESKTVNKP
jgi:hypothetical protein